MVEFMLTLSSQLYQHVVASRLNPKFSTAPPYCNHSDAIDWVRVTKLAP